MAKRVLIVDDSLYMRTIINNILAEQNYDVVGQAADGETAIDLALTLEPDLITLDNILPDMLGLDIIRTLKGENLDVKIIMVSAVGQQSVIDTGLELGADSYIVKPFTPEQFTKIVNQVMV